jgi:hypothetical protein
MKHRLLWVTLLLAMLGAVPAFAQFTVIATPTSGYTSSTTVMAIPDPNFTVKSSLTDGTQTLTFSSNVDVRTAAVSGGGWATWNSPPAVESHTPKVLFANNATTFTITLSSPSTTFGFELEPNNGTQAFTVTYFNGGTALGSIPLTIAGTSGALLAAASTNLPITSVVITAPSAAGGFAMAQFRYGTVTQTVPTLGPPVMGGLALALLAAGALFARRQNLDLA